MEIEVRNYRGIERARIVVSPIALLAGANYQGKTSLCQATAATLSGHPVPFLKPSTGKGNPWSGTVAKADAGVLVRTGADRGSCTIKKDDENQAATVWPQADLATKGTPPHASVFASGLMTEHNVWQLFALNDKQRASFFSDLLKAEPAYEEFSDALGEHDISTESIDKLWEAIETNGWEAVHNSMVTHGTKLKGQWEGATGDNYGSKKGAQWIPDGWQDNLNEASEDGLNAILVSAKEILEGVVGKMAVGNEERARLEKESHYDGPTLKAAEKAYQAAKKHHEKMIAARDALPTVDAGTGPFMLCPHCEKPVLLLQNSITSGVTEYTLAVAAKQELPKDEKNKRRLDIADADGKVRNAEGSLSKAGRELGRAKAGLEKAKDAAKTLEGLAGGEFDEEEIDKARQSVTEAVNRLDMFRAYNKARALHDSVKRNQQIIDTLSPTGLRKKVLTGALTDFNGYLNDLTKLAGWNARVELDENLQLRYGGRAFIFISDSEKYRVRATLQVAIAKLDKSDMIVLDGADILGKQGRNGLMKLLVGAKIPALVSMTIDSADLMPDLPAAMGVSYWVENGLVRPLKEVR